MKPRTRPYPSVTKQKQKLQQAVSPEISATSDAQMTPPLWQKVKRY